MPCRMYGVSDSQLAMLARAFAVAGHVHVPLFRTISRLVSGRLDSMPARELTSIAWALAMVGGEARQLCISGGDEGAL